MGATRRGHVNEIKAAQDLHTYRHLCVCINILIHVSVFSFHIRVVENRCNLLRIRTVVAACYARTTPLSSLKGIHWEPQIGNLKTIVGNNRNRGTQVGILLFQGSLGGTRGRDPKSQFLIYPIYSPYIPHIYLNSPYNTPHKLLLRVPPKAPRILFLPYSWGSQLLGPYVSPYAAAQVVCVALERGFGVLEANIGPYSRWLTSLDR